VPGNGFQRQGFAGSTQPDCFFGHQPMVSSGNLE